MDTYDILLEGAALAEKYQHSSSEDEKEKLVMKVFTGIYFNMNKLLFSNNEEDFNSDFALYFYDRVPAILENYKAQNSSFITYVIAYLKFARRSFYHQEKFKRNSEDVSLTEEKFRLLSELKSLEQTGCYDLYACENKVSYTKDAHDCDKPEIKCRSGRDKKFSQFDNTKSPSKFVDKSFYFSMAYKERLIFLLACKSCMFLDEDLVEKIAEEINLPVHKLNDILENLRNHCIEKQRRLDASVLKQNSHYIKMKTAKKFLDSADETENSIYLRTIKTHNGSYHAWMNARKRDKHRVKYPSNRLIGRYLNISKSSVDKNLEKALKELYT